jgi:hypothetical protein
MIHIVFNEVEVDLLKQVIELDETLQGEVIQIQDDYAVGPIENVYTEEGAAIRYNWWGEVLAGTDHYSKWEHKEVNDHEKVNYLKNALNNNADEILWIWCAQNKHDVSGYYWLMSQFKDYQGKVYILYLNNLPFFNDKGQIFYPEWLSQIPAKEFLKAKKLARAITLSEFEVDPDEWNQLGVQQKYVRLLEGGKKLIQKEVNFYDKELLDFVTNDFQKATKIINNYSSKAKHTTGDAFLMWRLKEMVTLSDLESQNNSGKIKDWEFKKPGNSDTAETNHIES